ncbi:ABC transporter ATP-binding protein [Mucilaginibacter auburnensis]|uniref:Peptide/nickel transport system ATP-binding protein n=1 Tax=Mucilaginibacter auburnensis TaxID=1457233 RepID=A0A2H9VVL4_9SPHI|nr:ABC transporter ATP-binding protein [Mucilaginibacter auburnensis]PJJ84822.1 peptide/nickel transport system ATP-binding protein [Mucilaginibacter auburnensis]
MLKVENLAVDFNMQNGVVRAVNSISFALNKGETLGIVGESGSGKSVTSLALMRLLNTNANISGSAQLENSNLFELSEKEMRSIRGNKIAMIFQEPMTSLNPVLTCGFQVIEAIQLHTGLNKTNAKAKAIELFNEVQLPRPEAIFDSYPHQLSGGQKQRVMIAMALACDPELLIADEPTTALDVTVQKTIIELLRKVKNERGMSLILISHDLGVVSEIADNVLVMYRGDIVEQGSVAELFNNPQHPYTKGLLACRPSVNIHLKKLPVIADFMTYKSATVETMRQLNGYQPGEITARREKLYNSKPILKVENLSTWFSQNGSLFISNKNFVKAVNNVSFEVYHGETLGLVGESGCGKTTLGRSILRLIEPTAGSINFQGNDIRKLSGDALRTMRRDMQIIFQDPYSSLNPQLTIGQAVLEPLQVHRLYNNDTQRTQKVKQLLDLVNLSPDHFNRYPHEFSGGQRQRIVIARALALEPKFIICDESVSALDVSVQAQVLNLIRQLQEELGLSYIFISHDLAVIRHISDRMMVMNKGEIVEAGYPEDIYNAPKEAYTRKLISAIPSVY